MAAAWTLRVRGPSGQATLSAAGGGDTTVAALQELVAEKLLVAPPRQELLCGFPPRPLQLGDAGATIASVGVANGDSLTLREKEAPVAAAEPAPAAAASAAAPTGAVAAAGSGFVPGSQEDEDAQLAAAIAASLADSQPQQQQQPQHAAPPPPPPRQQQQPREQQYSHPTTTAAAAATASNGSGAGAGRTANGAGPAPTSVRLPDGACVVRRVIPSDNSCLFTAVGYAMERDRGRAAALRRVIADSVAADPVTYNEGFLGQQNPDYCAWILDKKHWGGAIELSILARHYGRQIAAFDIQTKRCDVYGERGEGYGDGYGERAMVIYDGLHYDALAVAAFEGAPEELDVTVLTVGSAEEAAATAGARQLVEACHAARQFTDTATFTLRCGVCQVGLKGEKEAVAHAKETGHSSFQET